MSRFSLAFDLSAYVSYTLELSKGLVEECGQTKPGTATHAHYLCRQCTNELDPQDRKREFEVVLCVWDSWARYSGKTTPNGLAYGLSPTGYIEFLVDDTHIAGNGRRAQI